MKRLLALLFAAQLAHAAGSGLHRLEPAGHRVLHGAGQSPDAFREYFEAVGTHKPVIYMAYIGLGAPPDRIMGRLADLKRELDSYRGDYLIPEIGLSMTVDEHPEKHYEQKVAAGELDRNIDAFCEGLRGLGHPAFVRIGYEFNQPSNGYRPATYKAVWKRIVGKMRAHGLDDVATVWCVGASEPGYMKYYPGDDTVDWWGIDLFSDVDLSGFSDDFAADAARRGYPVIIGESTPRYVGVAGGEASWQKWFKPYFAFIARHENVKAFCYISWDWAKRPFLQWANWGDGRIAGNPVVLNHYKAELANPSYINGADAATVRTLLHIRNPQSTP